MSRPVRGAFSFTACVAVLAVGCGGRTSNSGSSSSGSSAGASVVASASGLINGGSGANASAGVVGGTSATGEPATSGIDHGPSCHGGPAANVLICPNGATCQYDAAGLPYCACGGSSGAGVDYTGDQICGADGGVGIVCVDEHTDPNNCGACGVVCPCGTCQNGSCTPITDASADASTDGTAAPKPGVDAGTPPSCAPGGAGMTNCGSGGSGTESCCTSLEVTGGTYFRTYTNSGSGPTGEADLAMVSSFKLDKYLVTVGRFRQFVAAWNSGAGYLPPAGSGKHTHLNSGLGLVNVGADDAGVTYERGWLSSDNVNMAPTDTNLTTVCNVPSYATWTSAPGGKEDLPINCVNSYEAYAFCIWDGGFLPSEAEWEYAAAGGSQQREYPWGSTAPGTANEYAIYSDIPTTVDCYYPTTAACTGVANIAPVGTATLGVGLWGQLDMAGEMSEWNLDWYPSPYVDPCTDCAYLTFNAGGGQVFRGGGFCYFAESECLRPPTRNFYPPASRSWFLGFRCARIP